MSKITPIQLIDAFINGETNMWCNTTGLGENLHIYEDEIIYYGDVVCRRIEDKYLVLRSNYSSQRRALEQLLLKMIPQSKRI